MSDPDFIASALKARLEQNDARIKDLLPIIDDTESLMAPEVVRTMAKILTEGGKLPEGTPSGDALALGLISALIYRIDFLRTSMEQLGLSALIAGRVQDKLIADISALKAASGAGKAAA